MFEQNTYDRLEMCFCFVFFGVFCVVRTFDFQIHVEAICECVCVLQTAVRPKSFDLFSPCSKQLNTAMPTVPVGMVLLER